MEATIDVAHLRAVLEADSSKADATLTAFEARLNKLGQKTIAPPKITPPDIGAAVTQVRALERALNDLTAAQRRAANAPPIGAATGAGTRALPPTNPSSGGRRPSPAEAMQSRGFSNVATGSFVTSTLVRPLMSAGGQAIAWGREFEETMQHIIGLTEVSRGELEMLRRGVLALSSDPAIRQGPAELADALYYVSSTGLQGADALRVLRASALGASAGLGETNVVANTVTTVLDAYGLASDKASRVTDTLTEAVRYGKGEADKYAAAFPKVVAIAAQAGVSFEEVAAQMASATRVGLSPSETATALRQIFNNLIDPSDKSAKAMKKLGTSVEEVRAKLREKGLFNTLKDLMARSGGQIGPITELFGNIRALTGFLSTTGTGTLAEYKKTLDGINGAQNSTYTAAAIASETLAFGIDKLKAAAEKAGIEMSERLLPVLTRVAKVAGRDLPAYLDGAQRTWESFGSGPQTALKYLGGLILLSGPLRTVVGTVQILGSAFAPLLGIFTALRTGAPILALLGRATIPTAILTTGILLWRRYADSVEEARNQQEALRGNTQNLDRVFSRALGAVEDPRAQKAMKELSASMLGAGNDAEKLKAALKKATEFRAEIPGLHLSPTAAVVLQTEAERAISHVQSRLQTLGVNLEVRAPVAHTQAEVRQQVQPWEMRARAAGIAFPAEPNLAALPATLTSSERAARHREAREAYLREVEETKRRIIAAEQGLNRDLARADARLASASEGAAARSNAPVDRVPRALEKQGKDLKALTAILQEYNAAVAKGQFRDAANVDALGQLRTRVNDLRGQAKIDLEKAADAKRAREADAALKAQQQAQADADRARDAEVRSLSERLQMWQGFNGLVEQTLGRMTQLSEQGSQWNEKTAKSRMEAQLLKAEYDGIEAPLKAALVELSGIEATMARIVGQRDGFRALFDQFAQGMNSSQLKGFGARVDDFAKSLGLGRQMEAAQQRAREVGSDLSATAQGQRRSLQQEQERLRFAGTKDAGVYEPLYPSEAGNGATDNRSFDSALTAAIIKGVSTPMGSAACARFVSKAFDILGVSSSVKRTDVARDLARNAKAAGAKRIPVEQAGAGDLLVAEGRNFGAIKDKNGNGVHVGIGVGNGMFAAKNRDRYSKIAGYGWSYAYDTSALASGGRQVASAPQPSSTPTSSEKLTYAQWKATVGPDGFSAEERAANARAARTSQAGVPRDFPAPNLKRDAQVPAAPKQQARQISLPPFEKMDTSLLTRRGMPAGWGSMMADHSFNTKLGESTRWRTAMEDYLLAEMGKGQKFSKQQLQGARQLANEADLDDSINAAKKETQGRIQTLSREMRLMGASSNPYLVLLDEIQSGLHDYDKAGAQRELGLVFQQMQRGATTALDAARKRAMEQRSISAAGNKYLQGDSPDFFGAQRAREEREAEIAAWADAETVKKFQLEKTGKEPKGSANRYALDLQAIARAGREQSRGDKRLDAEARAAQSYSSELQVLVAQRQRLGAMGAAPEQAVARALKSLSDYQQEYSKNVDEFGPVVARSMALDYQKRQQVLDVQREQLDADRERLALFRAAGEAEAALASRKANGTTPRGRLESEMDAWARGELRTKGSIDPRAAGAKRRELEAQFQGQTLDAYAERLSSIKQSMAQLGDESGLAALEVELLSGALSGLDATQKQRIRTGEMDLALLRKRLETGDRVAESERQAEMARARSTRERLQIEWKYQDKARERREAETGTTQDPRFRAMEMEARARDAAAAERQDLFERTRTAGQEMQGVISDSLKTGFDEGLGAGLGSFASRVRDALLDAQIQRITGRLTKRILGEDAVAPRQPGLFDMLGGKVNATPGAGGNTGGLLDAIGGFAGGALSDVLGGGAGIGSAPAAAQTIALMPQIVNVTTTGVVNVTGAMVTVSGGGASSSSPPGAPGSKASSEQKALGVLGALANVLR